MAHQKPFVIGITGGSASGKTLFLKSLLEHFTEEEVCLISQDNYYRPNAAIPRDHNGIENYDLPECIDFDQYAKDLESLIEGKSISIPEYTFNNPNAVPKMLEFHTAPILVVEGLFVFHEEQIAKNLDLKVFVDAKEEIKLKRRIARDNVERGYDMDDVIYRWKHHVRPAYDKYIKPTKKVADLVVNNNTHFGLALEILATYLKTKLAQA
ncbi:uridine kinase [Marinilongibacter aquaticus]|uniref:uridine kinase n=1 Tax=Marinilongibacter aquaticus TaxID=2975157 RepID=UPI00286E34D2|nr:uridine kinase [Marinilongibacter aquaticus]